MGIETSNLNSKETPLRDFWFYAIGEGGTSLIMNGIAGFAMLFYTQVLGLSAAYAGLALGITTLWDAVSDPIMGHVTDNTRSRFGRRHIYMFIGGILMSISFLFLWFVPSSITGNGLVLFWYLLIVNLILRTAITVFIVPFSALGFEICTTYEGRSKLQGIRNFFNMVVNFTFIAMGWVLFFQDSVAADGSRIDGTTIYSNYTNMGVIMAVFALVFTMVCVFTTRKYAIDTSNRELEGNNFKSFIKDIFSVLIDKYALFVFGLLAFALFAMQITSQLQMFVYVDYMKFTAMEKTFVHGAGMVAFALGALLSISLVKKIEKSRVAIIGIFIGITGNVLLLIFFIGGIIDPQYSCQIGSLNIPVSVILFGSLQFLWHGGSGIIIPLSMSMMADVSEISKIRFGTLKDGTYSAMYSFIYKAACSVGLVLCGIILNIAGYSSEAGAVQSFSVARNVAIATFLCGPVVFLFTLPILMKYPISRKMLEKYRNEAES